MAGCTTKRVLMVLVAAAAASVIVNMLPLLSSGAGAAQKASTTGAHSPRSRSGSSSGMGAAAGQKAGDRSVLVDWRPRMPRATFVTENGEPGVPPLSDGTPRTVNVSACVTATACSLWLHPRRARRFLSCCYHQTATLALLSAVLRELREAGLEAWVSSGALMGWTRFGCLLPWDGDVDIHAIAPPADGRARIEAALHRVMAVDPEAELIDEWASFRSFTGLGVGTYALEERYRPGQTALFTDFPEELQGPWVESLPTGKHVDWASTRTVDGRGQYAIRGDLEVLKGPHYPVIEVFPIAFHHRRNRPDLGGGFLRESRQLFNHINPDIPLHYAVPVRQATVPVPTQHGVTHMVWPLPADPVGIIMDSCLSEVLFKSTGERFGASTPWDGYTPPPDKFKLEVWGVPPPLPHRLQPELELPTPPFDASALPDVAWWLPEQTRQLFVTAMHAHGQQAADRS